MTSKEIVELLCELVDLKELINRGLILKDINNFQNQLEKDLEVLEQHKKIEEELGVDLITLFKVISQGYIFVREHNTEEKEIVAEDVKPNFLNHTFDFKEPRKEIGKGRPFSRIGTTWALTREELENDK